MDAASQLQIDVERSLFPASARLRCKRGAHSHTESVDKQAADRMPIDRLAQVVRGDAR